MGRQGQGKSIVAARVSHTLYEALRHRARAGDRSISSELRIAIRALLRSGGR